MKLRPLLILPLVLVLAAWSARGATDADSIAALGEAFAKDFAKGDAASLAAAWLPDGDYTDVDGRTFRGRAEIEAVFRRVFAREKGATLRIDSELLRQPAPDLAIEQGTTSVAPAAGGPPSRARYTNVLAKKDGRWFLASVQEAPYFAPDRSPELAALRPLLGNWTATTKSGETLRVTVAPATGGNFLVLDRIVLQRDTPVAGGTEWIGWDPAAKGIRSWSFESDGGFSAATWKPDGDAWTVTTEATLRDGRTVKETQSVTAKPDGTLTVATRESVLDGKPQPTPEPLTFKRPN